YLRYGPEIKTFPRAKGKINFLTSFVDLHFNNLDRPAYPNAGNVFGIEAGINYNQHPDYTYSDGVSEEVHDFPDFDKKTYYTIKYNSAHYLPINRHSIFLKVHSGMHFGNKQPLLNDFLIGGNNPILRNQILFPGFRANSVYSSSVVASQIGFQYNFSKKFIANMVAGYLKYDFIKTNFIFEEDHTRSDVFGMGLTGVYQSLIGPLEGSVMYNEINNKFSPLFNIGYSLNF